MSIYDANFISIIAQVLYEEIDFIGKVRISRRMRFQDNLLPVRDTIDGDTYF